MTLRHALVFATITLALTACGSSGDDPSSSTTGPGTNTDVVAGVRISPSTATVTVGGSVDFSATTLRSDGTAIGAATGVTWSVSD
ncbi:MAG: hypothetical protein H3C62_08300, partial [Gemmatimonadaceae bacterium]|nr:hypothetical protein [Gemmatimonadaceae bacterium]